jgi:hypothetical protein
MAIEMSSKFQEWIAQRDAPTWSPLPLTHITRTVFAEKIMDAGEIGLPEDGDALGTFAYTFYGRPAYRANKDTTVAIESSCPLCFLFEPNLLLEARRVHPFDSGAFNARLYNKIIDEGMSIDDFIVDPDFASVQRLIAATFPDQEAYFEADRSKIIEPDVGAKAWELQAKAYLTLLSSPGRNEPDDRICSIEVCYDQPISLERLEAVVAPHTFWNGRERSPQLQDLSDKGVSIETYKFVPGRHPEYYQTLVEQAVWSYLVRNKFV